MIRSSVFSSLEFSSVGSAVCLIAHISRSYWRLDTLFARKGEFEIRPENFFGWNSGHKTLRVLCNIFCLRIRLSTVNFSPSQVETVFLLTKKKKKNGGLFMITSDYKRRNRFQEWISISQARLWDSIERMSCRQFRSLPSPSPSLSSKDFNDTPIAPARFARTTARNF